LKMKRKWLIWVFTSALSLLGSCNIKAPIEEMLIEGNAKVAAHISLSAKNDTLSIRDYLPQIGTFDSISSGTLITKSIKNESDQFILCLKKNDTAIHEIQIWKQGKKSSLIAIQQNQKRTDPNTVKLEMKSFLNNVIFVSGIENPKQIFVLWQNTLIPERFITNDKKGISILIPKEAKIFSQSSIRVFVVNNQNDTGILTIALTNGEPQINH